MPPWMIPSRSSSSTGTTSANSTAAWPCSERRLLRRRLDMCVGAEAGGGGEQSSCPPPRGLLLERADDRVDRAGDLRAEREHHDGDDDCDQGEDEAILGHCLTVLALDVVLDPLCGEIEHLTDSCVWRVT